MAKEKTSKISNLYSVHCKSIKLIHEFINFAYHVPVVGSEPTMIRCSYSQPFWKNKKIAIEPNSLSDSIIVNTQSS